MEKSKLYKGIQTLCIKNDTNIAQLAMKIDKNPSNFYKRLQKSKLSDEEIEYIANQLGYTFDYTFKPLPKKKTAKTEHASLP